MTDYPPAQAPEGPPPDRDPPRALTGDFVFGQRFSVRRDIPNNRYIVQDAFSKAVAILPLQSPREVITRAGRWRIGPERHGRSWAVVARTRHDASSVACAHPRWRPNAYKLWVAPDSSYRLKQSWLRGDWALSDAGGVHRAADVRWLYRVDRHVGEHDHPPAARAPDRARARDHQSQQRNPSRRRRHRKLTVR